MSNIHCDYEYKGFKVRTHRQIVGCAKTGEYDLWFRTIAWDGDNVYRGESMPIKPDAEQDALNWIDVWMSYED